MLIFCSSSGQRSLGGRGANEQVSSETQTKPTAPSATAPSATAAETTPAETTPAETTPAEAPAEKPAHDDAESSSSELRPLPAPIRIALYFFGWFLLLVGILGLALPGIQGVLTIAFGAALLSLASEAAHHRLRSLLRRWPAADRLMERFRAKVHRRLGGKTGK